jgi:hypothetical protein
VVSMGSASGCVPFSSHSLLQQTLTALSYLSRLQEPHRIQRLLYIRDLVLEPRSAPMCLCFHELVFAGEV